MQDIESLKARLAREELELVEARREIDESHHRIEELRKHADGLEKRIKLLREYIELADSGGGDPELASLLEAPAAQALANPLAAPAAAPARPAKRSSPTAKKRTKGSQAAPPTRKQDLVEADFDPVLPHINTVVPQPPPGPSRPKEMPTSFDDDIDERIMADEILPRADTFEEALLFLMANHRKRLTPQGIIKEFRRYEHTPEVPATKDAIVAQIEKSPTFFAPAGKDGFVLTPQGREEAERMLSQLLL